MPSVSPPNNGIPDAAGDLARLPPRKANLLPKLRLTIAEFCDVTGTSRAKAYERIRRGELAVVRDGRQTFITAAEAARYAAASLPTVYPRKSAQAA